MYFADSVKMYKINSQLVTPAVSAGNSFSRPDKVDK